MMLSPTPREHLATSEDIYDCHCLGGGQGVLLAFSGRGQDVTKPPKIHSKHPQAYSAPNANSAEVEKP